MGQLIVQLCLLLRLRAVAVVSGEAADFEQMALWLRSLGAAEVLRDAGSFRVRLRLLFTNRLLSSG